MVERLRIDMDGVPLADEGGRVTAIFRFRTRDGILLNLPESIDVLVPWTQLTSASLDLRTGGIRLEFTQEGSQKLGWLSGARVLVGEWTDRGELISAPT